MCFSERDIRLFTKFYLKSYIVYQTRILYQCTITLTQILPSVCTLFLIKIPKNTCKILLKKNYIKIYYYYQDSYHNTSMYTSFQNLLKTSSDKSSPEKHICPITKAIGITFSRERAHRSKYFRRHRVSLHTHRAIYRPQRSEILKALGANKVPASC